LVQEYSQTIKAPQKDLIWFENSGHFPFFEEKRKFSMNCSSESCHSPLIDKTATSCFRII
jgi:hypothetical protein